MSLKYKMIKLEKKSDCCGCSACAQICPKRCITMVADEEGFLYPSIDTTTCTDCGLCQKICPVINQYSSKTPMAVYAAKNHNEHIRMESSSGGIFTPIAESIIAEGGVVFGAKFDSDWSITHSYTESIEGLKEFRGSKYVQSKIGDSYTHAKQFLDAGRKVLFTGTPCQIAGLKHLLRKEYNTLTTIEVICHGVPSPRIWHDYLEYHKQQMQSNEITDISFRDKSNGWHKYNFKICVAKKGGTENSTEQKCRVVPYDKDLFMNGFLKDIYLRPSCYACAAKEGRSGADISIADYWGVEHIHQQLDDDKGIGLVIVNTPKGITRLTAIASQIDYTVTDYAQAVAYNPSISRSVCEPKQRAKFWREYNTKKLAAIELTLKRMRPTKFDRLKNRIRRLVTRMINKK